ncbi:MAG: DUF6148 family protein, partial [Defluviitaleaceae bacterium]|nr:DUF6148 family protein [Defluviitaleaceae bacterium]
MINRPMSPDLALAKDMLHGWILAEQAVMTGQEYRMGTRLLRRADLRAIRDSIRYWKGEIDRMEGRSRIRTQQVIPR